MRRALIGWMIALALGGCGTMPAPPAFVFGSYKHAPIAFDASSQLLGTAVSGVSMPLTRALPAGVTQVSWAFATGECGDEHWGEGIDVDRFARANVQAFERAGIGFVVSTGGEGQQFSCGSDDGMERFIARYASPWLVGIDFDIESGQTDEAIVSLVRHARRAQDRHPALRMSFTLPTFAAADGSGRSLNALGERVLNALRAEHFDAAFLNLMAMDFGDAAAERCVLKPGAAGERCDMGRSALQAAMNLNQRYQVPMNRIEVTTMIGVNDVVQNVFTLADAKQFAAAAKSHGLAGMHLWSLDRDTACIQPTPGASDRCSGVAQAPLDFMRTMSNTLR